MINQECYKNQIITNNLINNDYSLFEKKCIYFVIKMIKLILLIKINFITK